MFWLDYTCSLSTSRTTVVGSYRLESDKSDNLRKRIYVGSIFRKKIQNNSIQEVVPRIFLASYRRASRLRLQKNEEKVIKMRYCNFEHECSYARTSYTWLIQNLFKTSHNLYIYYIIFIYNILYIYTVPWRFFSRHSLGEFLTKNRQVVSSRNMLCKERVISVFNCVVFVRFLNLFLWVIWLHSQNAETGRIVSQLHAEKRSFV